MRGMRAARALAAWLTRKQPASAAATDDGPPRSIFLGVGGRPMRLTVAAPTPDALQDATEVGEHPLRKASGALQLRGVARVNGQLIALHDIEGTRAPAARPAPRPEDRPTVSS